jgi:hypothetical protein
MKTIAALFAALALSGFATVAVAGCANMAKTYQPDQTASSTPVVIPPQAGT